MIPLSNKIARKPQPITKKERLKGAALLSGAAHGSARFEIKLGMGAPGFNGELWTATGAEARDRALPCSCTYPVWCHSPSGLRHC